MYMYFLLPWLLQDDIIWSTRCGSLFIWPGSNIEMLCWRIPSLHPTACLGWVGGESGVVLRGSDTSTAGTLSQAQGRNRKVSVNHFNIKRHYYWESYMYMSLIYKSWEVNREEQANSALSLIYHTPVVVCLLSINILGLGMWHQLSQCMYLFLKLI